jgi:hypothetical protein
MNAHPRRRLSRTLLIAGVCLACASTALAQATKKEEPLRPPTPPTSGSTWSPVLSLLVALAMGGLVLGVAFIPSKRGHQD